MRISGINHNVKFGKIEQVTAERLFRKATTPEETSEVKKLVILAEDKAKDFSVVFEPKTQTYKVHMPNKFWGNDKAWTKDKGFKTAEAAVDASIQMQKALSAYKLEKADTISERYIINYLT